MSLFKKLSGDQTAIPQRPAVETIALTALGCFCGISAVAALSEWLSMALLLGSFGASSVLVFGFPDVPFSQPRNVVGGHFLSALVGLVCVSVFGPQWWAVGLAVGAAVALMMLTGVTHPPATSNPVIVFLTQPAWDFLLFPTLAGAVILVAVALIYNNVARAGNYPKYW